MSTQRVIANKAFVVRVVMDAAWRRAHGIGAEDVMRAAQPMRVVVVESARRERIASCPKCGRNGAREIVVMALSPRCVFGPCPVPSSGGALEVFTFDACRVTCTSSRVHIRSALALAFDIRGLRETVLSEPFEVVSKPSIRATAITAARKKASEEKESDTSSSSSSGSGDDAMLMPKTKAATEQPMHVPLQATTVLPTTTTMTTTTTAAAEDEDDQGENDAKALTTIAVKENEREVVVADTEIFFRTSAPSPTLTASSASEGTQMVMDSVSRIVFPALLMPAPPPSTLPLPRGQFVTIRVFKTLVGDAEIEAEFARVKTALKLDPAFIAYEYLLDSNGTTLAQSQVPTLAPVPPIPMRTIASIQIYSNPESAVIAHERMIEMYRRKWAGHRSWLLFARCILH
jgi:hypothetical protein